MYIYLTRNLNSRPDKRNLRDKNIRKPGSVILNAVLPISLKFQLTISQLSDQIPPQYRVQLSYKQKSVFFAQIQNSGCLSH